MKITVNVTQDDIDQGKPRQCGYCPVALAISRALAGAGEISVFITSVLIFPPSLVTIERIFPDDVSDFIARYDTGRPVEPFTFELDVPDQLVPAAIGGTS